MPALSYRQRVTRIAVDLRLLMPWLPPHLAARYAAEFAGRGALL